MTHAERNRRWATSHGRKLARRRTYGAMVDAGVCVTCQSAPAAHDRVRCLGCGERYRLAKRKARDAASLARSATIGTTPDARGGQSENAARSASHGAGETAPACEAVQ